MIAKPTGHTDALKPFVKENIIDCNNPKEVFWFLDLKF